MAINKTAYRVQRTACRCAGGRAKLSARRGFALLIAVIFMSVMLSFGLVLGSLAYKQQSLASTSIDSQYAFYAADTALECALYADQRQNAFAYNADSNSPVPTFVCAGSGPVLDPVRTYTGSGESATQRIAYRFLLDGASCADVTVYKPSGAGTTYLFAQGYSVPCDTVASPEGARFSSRGVEAHY